MGHLVFLIAVFLVHLPISLSTNKRFLSNFNQDPFPILHDNPLISINNSGTAPNFKCTINYPVGNGASFSITWSIGSNIIGQQNLTSSQRSAYLDVNLIKGYIGNELYCYAESYYITTPKTKSGIYSSKGYFCGIKIYPPILYNSGQLQNKTVKVTSTIPVQCSITNELNLNLHITSHDTSFLYLNQARLSWKQARTECQRQGYQLANLDTKNKWAKAVQFLKNQGFSKLPVWIGLHYNSSGFEWIDGVVPTDTIPWDTSEPDHLYQEHCVYIHTSTTKYRTADCTSSIHTLCSKSDHPISTCKRQVLTKLNPTTEVMNVELGKLTPNVTRLIWFSVEGKCPLFDGYKVGPLQVLPGRTTPPSFCSIRTTSVTTFDGTRYSPVLLLGETTLLVTPKYEKVQGRFWVCQHGPCLCSVTVQFIEEAVKIDRCQRLRGSQSTNFQISHVNGSKSSGIVIEGAEAHGYNVSLPTGLLVTIHTENNSTSSSSLKVQIYVTSDHKGRTAGICGLYDDNPVNDLRGRIDHTVYSTSITDLQAFISSWKIPMGQSLFEHNPYFHGTTKPSFDQCECSSSTSSALC